MIENLQVNFYLQILFILLFKSVERKKILFLILSFAVISNFFAANNKNASLDEAANWETIENCDLPNFELNRDFLLPKDKAIADEINQDDQLRKTVELVQRKGLPNFFTKAQKGKKIRVCYFGGSITKQKGWRVQSLDFFCVSISLSHFYGTKCHDWRT